MNILRLLFLVAAGWLVWRIVRQVRAQMRPPADLPPPQTFEAMERCAKCGTHLPAQALSQTGLCGRCQDQS